MTATSIALPTLVCDDISISRLHGEACWHCGAVSGSLSFIGQVSTAAGAGTLRLRPVVGCPTHQRPPTAVPPSCPSDRDPAAHECVRNKR
ncbi:hypothetical protein [Actinacidiphila guanduensis]|uniref:Uncharacterized protein n=1 Tax=Actinacidiphila guanduensis TaxID=310781 RepID=A0A1H0K184_9ACTN|nr:hypothetical protein [Actinacidiphila guanduensis]SDO49686.1 hypothetical protein SAMN05216259_11071 [Actinacidiphila guanduensis]